MSSSGKSYDGAGAFVFLRCVMQNGFVELCDFVAQRHTQAVPAERIVFFERVVDVFELFAANAPAEVTDDYLPVTGSQLNKGVLR